jgi:hypothetical protein
MIQEHNAMYPIKLTYFLHIYYHTPLQRRPYFTSSSAVNDKKKLKVQCGSGVLWHNDHTKYSEHPSSASNGKRQTAAQSIV